MTTFRDSEVTLTFDGKMFRLMTRDRNPTSIKAPGGFYWDKAEECYVTPSYQCAERVRMFADRSAARALDRVFIRITPLDGDIPRPPEGLAYMSRQSDWIRFALERNRSYLALEQGLGKAICGAMIAAHHGRAVVYFVPPYLLGTIRGEFSKWAPGLRQGVLNDKRLDLESVDVLFVPDSLLSRPRIRDPLLDFVQMYGDCSTVLIVDEAHRYKDDRSARCKALFGVTLPGGQVVKPAILDLFDRAVFMSGTPAPNGSMIELFPVLSKAAPETISFMNRFNFSKYYCGAFKNQFGHWELSKTPSKERVRELGRRVIHPTGKFMLRVKKKDSGLRLPPKIEELFIVSGKRSARLASLDAAIGKRYRSDEDLMRALLTVKKNKDAKLGDEMEDLHFMEYWKLLGTEKVQQAIVYIKSIMEETDESILVFARHDDVIRELWSELLEYEPLVISGETTFLQRTKMVGQFQTQAKYRLMVGNYQAMGTGFTLTKAKRVLFVEFSWVPAENDQAADRAHRIGQDDTVYVQYMVYQDSLDKRILEAILRKRENQRVFDER